MKMDEEEEEDPEEEYQDEKAVLEHVFGPSSSSSERESESEEEQQEHQHCSRDWDWEQIQQVKGLWICRDFLSPRHQALLLSAIEAQNWFAQPNTNQAMRFGDLPPWALHLSHSIRRSLLEPSRNFLPLPLHLLSREPLFDQMIANLYQPGEGICAHVDLLRFEDAIAIVSLESSCVMHFTPVVEDDATASGAVPVPVLLTPGSLVVMSGEARYRWKHEINRRPGFQVWEGKELDQSRRISITLRKLCPNP